MRGRKSPSKGSLQMGYTFDKGGPSGRRRSPRRWGQSLLVGGALVSLTPVLGGVFSSTISMSSPDMEFGQGVAAMVHCDTSIEITTSTDWNETSSAFEVSSFTVSGIDTGACLGKTLTVSAYSTGTELDVCDAGCTENGLSFSHVVGESDTTLVLLVAGGIDPSSITDLAVTTS